MGQNLSRILLCASSKRLSVKPVLQLMLKQSNADMKGRGNKSFPRHTPSVTPQFHSFFSLFFFLGEIFPSSVKGPLSLRALGYRTVNYNQSPRCLEPQSPSVLKGPDSHEILLLGSGLQSVKCHIWAQYRGLIFKGFVFRMQKRWKRSNGALQS